MARRRRQEPGRPPGGEAQAAAPGAASDAAHPVCPLCERTIPPEAKQSLHHLIPKLKGGKHGPTVLLHQICHDEIHAALTEAELARGYATVEALRGHPRIAKFVEWVGRRPPTFHAPTAGRPRRRGRET